MNQDIAQHLDALEAIVRKTTGGVPAEFEGNAFYEHRTFRRHPDLIPKQVQLFAMGGQIQKSCVEIGLNAGHSMLLFLLGRRAVHGKSPVDCYIFDINEHAYTVPCLEYLKTAFPEANFKFFKGDSTVEVPAFIAGNPGLVVDLVHVDGGHFEHCIRSDFGCAERLVVSGGHIIVDDTNDPIINRFVEIALHVTGTYKEVAMYRQESNLSPPLWGGRFESLTAMPLSPEMHPPSGGDHHFGTQRYESLPMYPHRILQRI